MTTSPHRGKFLSVLLLGFTTIAVSFSVYKLYKRKQGHSTNIGNTSLIRIDSLSRLTGTNIYGKCEFQNSFGSVKDRIALKIIDEAEKSGQLTPGSCIFEGTSGSTGISIAGIAKQKGYKSYIVVPTDMAKEKLDLLYHYGSSVEPVPSTTIVDQGHYVNVARRRAQEYTLEHQNDPVPNPPKGYFVDQFENLMNAYAHYTGTAPEIWHQTHGELDAFISGAGTGGTLAGTSRFLKKKNPSIQIVLVDPPGSGLYHKVKDGVMFSDKEREGTKRRHQVDTVTEGIGLNRLTENFKMALPYIDDAIQYTDEEIVAMSRFIYEKEGIFLGSSSSANLVGCVKLAKKWGFGSNKTIVTILCDSGKRHLSRFWSDNELKRMGIAISDHTVIDDLLNCNEN